MIAFIYGALAWAMSGLIPTLLVGAGLSLVTFTALNPLIETMLESAASSLNGLPLAAVQWTLLSGAGDALSILGSAILTRLSIVAASNALGLRKTT